MKKYDALAPMRSTSLLLFLLAALGVALSFWIVPLLVMPHMSADAWVFFREHGDADYLPQVAATADLNFGESSVKEYAGTGVRSFPYVPVLIHAILYRLGGSVGFILADIVIVILYAYLLRLYLRISGVDDPVADLLSLAVISGIAVWVVLRAGGLLHTRLPVIFWFFRLPRPFVTEAVFLLFLIGATQLVARPERTVGFFALFGASFAMVLQSDIYRGCNAAFVAGAVFLIVLLTTRNRWAAAQRLSAATTAFGIACLPFVYQQMHTSPDVKRRWGAFSTDRYRAFLPDFPTMLGAAVVIMAAVVLVRLYRGRASMRPRIAALAVCTLTVAASIVSGPASLALLHQGIQVYHFQEETTLTIGYALLLYAGWLLTDAGQAFALSGLAKKLPSSSLAVASALSVAVCLVAAYWLSVRNNRSLPEGTWLSLITPRTRTFPADYRSNFQELETVLQGPECSDASVLGTFDKQLGNWWEYKHRYLYLADLFNTTLPDKEVESRVYQFLKMLGTSPEEFDALLNNIYFVFRVVGFAKYQANSLFTPWPLSDYSMAAQRRIALTENAFNIEIPESEKARHMAAYRRMSEVQQSENELDILILDKNELRPYFHPERSGRFRLLWSNGNFEVWMPMNRRPRAGTGGNLRSSRPD